MRIPRQLLLSISLLMVFNQDTTAQAPTITCPQFPLFINTDPGQCSATISLTGSFAATATGSPVATITYLIGNTVISSPHTFPEGTTTVTAIASNGISPDASCIFNVVVRDNELPAFQNCPSSITVYKNQSCDQVATWTPPTATDNCGINPANFFSNYVPGMEFPVGTTTVTYTAIDNRLNVSTCSFTVTVVDDPPVFQNCPADITLYVNQTCQPVATWTPPTTDCDVNPISLFSNYDPGDEFPVGTTVVTYTAVDNNLHGTTCSFNVTVVDDPPVLQNCPADITIYVSQACPPVATWTPPTTDCDVNPINLFSNYNTGHEFPVGTTTVTYTAVDNNFQASTCSFKVTVIDDALAIQNCPADITVYTSQSPQTCAQAATWTPPTINDCLVNPINFFSNYSPGAEFPRGTTRVTYTAVNKYLQGVTCSFYVTVIDNTPPYILNCPANITVQADQGTCTKVVTWTEPTAGDHCSGATLKNRSHAPGSNFNVGNSTVTYIYEDGAGNTSSCRFTVTVVPRNPPAITNESVSQSALAPPNHKMQNVTVSYSATDECGLSITNSLTVTSNEPANGTGDGDTSPDWIVVDDHHVLLRAERNATGEGRIYVISITSTNSLGLSSTKTVEVRVAHNITGPNSGKPFRIGSTVDFAGEFWDKPSNRHTAKWLIDGSTSVKGTVTEPTQNKNGKVTGSYKFASAGVYKLQMNVTDQNGVTSYANTNGDLEEIIVIYDPNGGYAYGGGWFNSPAGTLKSNPNATGKVSYGFSMNYFKNATLPKGETQLEFKVGDFEYNAVNFDYLSIAGAKAQFKGTGKIIGGQSGINFIMTVIDGDLDGGGVDKIRMKIYNKNNGQVYYDNEPGASDAADPVTPVGLNSVVAISSNNNLITRAALSEEIEQKSSQLEVSVLPNPTNTSFTLKLRSGNTPENVSVRVTDIYGRTIEAKNVNANQTFSLGSHYKPGTYFVKLVQGKEHKQIKLVKL